jgi:hypothetical protein
MAPVQTGAISLFAAGMARSLRRRELAMDEVRDCERCGKPIPRRRLEVLPFTRLCIECSEAIGGDFKTYVIPEHTGKPGSLKRNYGSWQ